MTSPDQSDLFEDPLEEIRRIKARKEELREEAKTATPERRKEIGWWMFGASKHMGRLMDVNLARRFGEHRFIIHEVEGSRIWAVCSCRARFPGEMHVNFTMAEFPSLEGHIEQGTAEDTLGAPQESR